MLILTREKNETILFPVGDDVVEVMVVDFRSNRVRLGIKAPEHIPVHRREVWEAIQRGESPKGKGAA